MVKNIKSGDEYKVLKQTSRAKKIAWAFSLLWIVLILVPVLNFCYKNSNALKNYVVVKCVYEMNTTIMSQYNDLSANLVKNINISKYTNFIIKQNLSFAIFIKLAILLLSILGLANMWFAVFADTGVTLLTILNTLRIRKKHTNIY